MFSRVTLVEIDALRIGVEEAVTLFSNEVLPDLRRRPGYEGALVLTTPEGRGMILTFWDREEHAAPDEDYANRIARYVTLFRAPPGREGYRVSVAELPALRDEGAA
jgi:hypothetical protein